MKSNRSFARWDTANIVVSSVAFGGVLLIALVLLRVYYWWIPVQLRNGSWTCPARRSGKILF